jgi:hypothetical protein
VVYIYKRNFSLFFFAMNCSIEMKASKSIFNDTQEDHHENEEFTSPIATNYTPKSSPPLLFLFHGHGRRKHKKNTEICSSMPLSFMMNRQEDGEVEEKREMTNNKKMKTVIKTFESPPLLPLLDDILIEDTNGPSLSWLLLPPCPQEQTMTPRRTFHFVNGEKQGGGKHKPFLRRRICL